MKKIFFVSLLVFFVTTIYAQRSPLKNALIQKDTVEQKKIIKYCCPKGNYSDIKPGQCPFDNSTLIPEGIYYCKVCDVTGKKPDKCPKCKNDMIQMECPETVIKETPEPIDKKK